MGYRSTTAQLFTVPPNMTAFITVIITAFASDRLKNRGYFVIGGSILGICGYVMMLVAKTNAVRYAGTFLVAIGVFQGSPMIMVRIPLLYLKCWIADQFQRAGLRTTSHRIMSEPSASASSSPLRTAALSSVLSCILRAMRQSMRWVILLASAPWS